MYGRFMHACRWREIAVFFLCSQQNYVLKLFLSWIFFYFHIFYMLDNFLHNQRHCYRPVRTTCSAHRNQIQNCMKEKSDARNLNIFHSCLSWAWMEIYDGFAVTKDDYVDLLGNCLESFNWKSLVFTVGFTWMYLKEHSKNINSPAKH